MKPFMLLCAILPFIPGCGTEFEYHTWTDSRLKPAIADWVLECRKHMKQADCNTYGIESITAIKQFKDPDTLGQCQIGYRGFNKVRQIQVRDDIDLNTYYGKALILHEMLHCRFDFETHTDSGIMSPRMYMTEEYMRDNWEELVEEAYNLVK